MHEDAPPPNPFDEQGRGVRMSPELIALQIDRQRQAEQPAPTASRTLADDFVRCLSTLLIAVDDMRSGRPLDGTAAQAVGDLSRILEVARARRVGLSSDFTTT
jgi:hypothetical protein